MSRDVVEFF